MYAEDWTTMNFADGKEAVSGEKEREKREPTGGSLLKGRSLCMRGLQLLVEVAAEANAWAREQDLHMCSRLRRRQAAAGAGPLLNFMFA